MLTSASRAKLDVFLTRLFIRMEPALRPLLDDSEECVQRLRAFAKIGDGDDRAAVSPSAICLDCVIYSAVFLSEDFRDARRGFLRLARRLEPLDSFDRTHERLSWFDNAADFASQQWINLGGFGPPRTWLKRSPFGNVYLSATKVSASLLTVTFILKPSKHFSASLLNVLGNRYIALPRALRWAVLKGPTSFGIYTEENQREAALDRLFDSFDRSFRRTFASCFPRTFVPNLSHVEVYELEGVGSPEGMPGPATLIGERDNHLLLFSNGRSVLKTPDRYAENRRHRGRHRYYAFRGAKDDRQNRKSEFSTTTLFVLGADLRDALLMCAITHEVTVMAQRVGQFSRDFLYRALRQSRIIKRPGGIGYVFRQIVKIDLMRLRLSRISAHFEPIVRERYAKSIRWNSSFKLDNGEPYSIGDRLNRDFQVAESFSRQNLEIIKSTFQDWLGFRTGSVNYRIQWIALLLTLVAIILAVLQVVPEKTRNEWFRDSVECFKTL